MDDARTVWCGNLSNQVTEELLYELFLQAAPLERVKIPTDKEGRRSNFAFITMKHEISVPYATQLLNGTSLFEKKINVKPRQAPQSQSNQRTMNLPMPHTSQNYRDREDDYRHDSRDNRRDYHKHDNRDNKHNEYGRHRRNYNRNYHERNNSRNRY
ncbi:unnamed protein product [Brassicogethes aeneus]|uniref:RRM domain-containing protein n=1 Tax=Brassicogethes aeneus TaxID=1431903 RepID=A0A9P0B2P0_BRAAE|nr:unnamed protein product [Brassicogethes aeneus]